MSLIGLHVRAVEKNRYDRFRAFMQIRSLWSDSAEELIERRVVEDLELSDREYAVQLAELDAEVDRAIKLLGRAMRQ